MIRGNASPYPTPLSDAIRTVLQRHVPEAELANSHSVGFTDSNWFRAAYPEIVAYNFAPHIVESYDEVTARYHNVDERIHVRDLAFQALFAEQLALELLKETGGHAPRRVPQTVLSRSGAVRRGSPR